MKMVVGLGNPGNRYSGTRHNVGFEVLAQLARQFGAGPTRQKFQAELAEVHIGDEKVALLSPLTFMNLSGASVQPARDFYQLEDNELLVVSDDLNLPVAQLRFRAKGGAGGQKGLADVIQRLGTQAVPRLRIGIGPVPPRWDAADFVLGKFTRDEREQIDIAIQDAVKAVLDWVKHDIQYCMNQYNGSKGDEAKGDEATGAEAKGAEAKRKGDSGKRDDNRKGGDG